MQFDVELSFEITNPKSNGRILMLLSMIFKIKCMHSLKHLVWGFFFLFCFGWDFACLYPACWLFATCGGNQPPNVRRIFKALLWDY